MNIIKKHREKRGMSQKELARAAGISLSLLTQIETDQKPVSKKTAEKLAPLLHLSPARIYLVGTGWVQLDADIDPLALEASVLAVLAAVGKGGQPERIAKMITATYPLAARMVELGQIKNDDLGALPDAVAAILKADEGAQDDL